MKLHIIPFNHMRAAADIETQEIFLSLRSLLSGTAQEDLAHELAHLVSRQADHGTIFNRVLAEFGFSVPADDVFARLRPRLPISACSCGNIGNITGIQNVLTDLHLLAAYRKFSKKILGTEGHWEVVNEVDGPSGSQLIRLYPTPKGVFPVVVMYLPVVTHFRSPQAKKLACDMLLAEAKCMLGAARRKLTGIPAPGGASINYDGDALVQEGQKEKDEIVQKALRLGEPDRIFIW